MTSSTSTQSRFVILIALCASLYAQVPRDGKNIIIIRGQEQKIYLYQAAGPGQHRKILFAPGDAGCRGFAVTIAEQLGTEGYDTYCLDVLHYLEGFTGEATLSTEQIASDFNQIARWIQQRNPKPILLVGWSEGAGFGSCCCCKSD